MRDLCASSGGCMNGARAHKKPARPYQRHGLCTLKQAVTTLGSRAIDRRTSLGRALGRWRAELLQDLGGVSAVSTQELVIVDLAVRTKLMLDSVDTWILEERSLVHLRKRALIPVVLQRQQMADALARYMGQLGLKRREKQIPTLAQYVGEKYRGEETKTTEAR